MNTTKRTLFLKDLLTSLQERKIQFCIVRGHENIFLDKESDIDILMSPSDYKKLFSIYMQLLDKYNGKLFTSNISNKNYYIRSLFINEDSVEIEGLYIHISAYITIKPTQKQKNNKLSGKHVWVDNIDILTKKLDGTTIPTPDYQTEIMFLLSAYINKGHEKYLTKIEHLLKIDSVYSKTSNKNNFRYLDEAIKSKSGNIDLPKLYDMCNELTLDLKTQKKTFYIKQYLTILQLNAIHFFRYKGKLIFFSGPDGSGKTTANDALTNLLKNKLKINIYNSKHLYPISNKFSMQGANIQAKIRKVPLSDTVTLERDRGHSRLWKARRLVGLLYILLQIYPGYLTARYKNWKGQTVIIDTSFFDAFIKGHRPSFPLLQKLSIPLIPCGDKWFLMKASPTEIVARKPELSIDELIFYYKSLNDIGNKAKCTPIEVASNKGVSVSLELMIEDIDKD